MCQVCISAANSFSGWSISNGVGVDKHVEAVMILPGGVTKAELTQSVLPFEPAHLAVEVLGQGQVMDRDRVVEWCEAA